MTTRAYTVVELDALRMACDTRFLYGTSRPNRDCHLSFWSRTYRPEERHRCVEEMLRTHMLAGHTAADLYAADDASAGPPA